MNGRALVEDLKTTNGKGRRRIYLSRHGDIDYLAHFLKGATEVESIASPNVAASLSQSSCVSFETAFRRR